MNFFFFNFNNHSDLFGWAPMVESLVRKAFTQAIPNRYLLRSLGFFFMPGIKCLFSHPHSENILSCRNRNYTVLVPPLITNPFVFRVLFLKWSGHRGKYNIYLISGKLVVFFRPFDNIY